MQDGIRVLKDKKIKKANIIKVVSKYYVAKNNLTIIDLYTVCFKLINVRKIYQVTCACISLEIDTIVVIPKHSPLYPRLQLLVGTLLQSLICTEVEDSKEILKPNSGNTNYASSS